MWYENLTKRELIYTLVARDFMVDNRHKEVIQLKNQLEITEKALELMAKSVWSEGISCVKFLDTRIQVNSQVEYLEYFKTKAKEMIEKDDEV